MAAWDIDVRPDFKGLPKGTGSVAQGKDVWEAKCASCHGIFGESNEVFTPLVGGTTEDDVKTGRVARLTDPAFPGRTTLMKVSTISTLWDYIHRAMPWNAPKSLKPDEVYAVTAFLLNLGGVVPDDFVLSDRNIAEAQQLLPNRNGMTTDARPVARQDHRQRRQARREGRGLHEGLRDRAQRGLVPARLRAQRPRQPGRAEPRRRRAASAPTRPGRRAPARRPPRRCGSAGPARAAAGAPRRRSRRRCSSTSA